MNKSILKTIETPKFTMKYGVKVYPIIKLDKIVPFKNICKVTGQYEDMNIEITYIPNNKLIELES